MKRKNSTVYGEFPITPNQEYANLRDINLYRVEFNGQWTNVWANNEQEARLYVYDNFCHFGVCSITKTKLLIQPTNRKEEN